VTLSNYLGENKFANTLAVSYATNTREILDLVSVQLTNERGQISGFSLQYELARNQQQSFLADYDIEIEMVDEAKEMIINWDKETVNDRNNRLLNIANLARNSAEINGKLIVQANQIIYDVQNVQLVELDRKESELEGQRSSLRLKRLLAWLGVGIGLLLLVALIIYTRRIYFNKDKAH
jgi:hypothetical protein